jgi:uncharacterized protein YegL
MGMKVVYATQILAGKAEGNTPLGESVQTLDDNINMNLKKMGCNKYEDWVHLALDRNPWGAFVNTVMNVSVP